MGKRKFRSCYPTESLSGELVHRMKSRKQRFGFRQRALRLLQDTQCPLMAAGLHNKQRIELMKIILASFLFPLLVFAQGFGDDPDRLNPNAIRQRGAARICSACAGSASSDFCRWSRGGKARFFRLNSHRAPSEALSGEARRSIDMKIIFRSQSPST